MFHQIGFLEGERNETIISPNSRRVLFRPCMCNKKGCYELEIGKEKEKQSRFD